MPLHPMLVHYPIAFTMLATIFQLLAVIFRRQSLMLPAVVALGLGALMAVSAAFTGTAQEEAIRRLPGIGAHLDRHASLGTLSAWLLSVGSLAVLYLYLKQRLHPGLFLASLLLATALLLVTGHFGAELVYRHGAGVAR